MMTKANKTLSLIGVIALVMPACQSSVIHVKMDDTSSTDSYINYYNAYRNSLGDTHSIHVPYMIDSPNDAMKAFGQLLEEKMPDLKIVDSTNVWLTKSGYFYTIASGVGEGIVLIAQRGATEVFWMGLGPYF